jgi:hypothetical protein
MAACLNGHASTTKLLLDRGCAINAVDNGGWTALHKACWKGSMECVKELLTYGADTSVKNKFGQTPLDLAKERNYQAAIDLLMEHTKRLQQALTNSIEDALTTTESEVSTLKAEVSSSEERLIARVETVIAGRQCEEQSSDRSVGSQDEMNQQLEKVIGQLTISNSELVKCVSNQSTTMVGHLISKISSIEREQESMKVGMTQIQEELKAMKATMARNLDQMNQSLQRLTAGGDHSILSNVNAGGGGSGDFERRKKGGDDFEKEGGSSLSVLKTIEEELHQSLSYCQSMLS